LDVYAINEKVNDFKKVSELKMFTFAVAFDESLPFTLITDYRASDNNDIENNTNNVSCIVASLLILTINKNSKWSTFSMLVDGTVRKNIFILLSQSHAMIKLRVWRTPRKKYP
jgi:hypothetical protein